MKNTPDANLMDTYRQQMLEMFRQASPSQSATPQEDNWLDRHYPEPNIEQDKVALTPEEQTSPPPTDTSAFVGYLRVFAYSGGGAEPIGGARVVVTQPNEQSQTVYANLITDIDGFTSVIALPSVDPALTLQPGTEKPYKTYTIRITADGFQPVEHRNVPVYGNNYVTQPVAMTPLLFGEDADNAQEFNSGGPTNL